MLTCDLCHARIRVLNCIPKFSENHSQAFGFFLPGFSLVDGLIRITERHAFVTWRGGFFWVNMLYCILVVNCVNVRRLQYFASFLVCCGKHDGSMVLVSDCLAYKTMDF